MPEYWAKRRFAQKNQALASGKISSMSALARQEKVTQRYITRLLAFAFLTPDIMEAIICGDIPPQLSLGRLKKGFPLDWKQQRLSLGFAH